MMWTNAIEHPPNQEGIYWVRDREKRVRVQLYYSNGQWTGTPPLTYLKINMIGCQYLTQIPRTPYNTEESSGGSKGN